MKYKVGDKVRVKSLEWYINNYEVYGKIIMGTHMFTTSMAKHCGCIVTIDYVCNDSYQIKEDDELNGWTDDMFEGLVKEETIQPVVFENIIADKVELCLGNDYEIVVEDGRTFVQKKKPKYPKTYEDCCRVLNVWYKDDVAYVAGYQNKLLSNFQKLLICRDAYWKIADFKYNVNITEDYFYIINKRGSIIKDYCMCFNHILAFPTKEMRDVFYENFKDLIEYCKELL